VSDETRLQAKHPGWTKSERELYRGAQVRVLGEVDRSGRLLVELLSGPLAGEFRWMSESELQRTEGAAT
jgi:hypothetical protein